MNNPRYFNLARFLTISFILLLLGLAACSSPTPPPAADTPTAPVEPLPTATEPPPPTPTAPPGKVLLVSAAPSPEFETALAALAAPAGLTLETRAGLQIAEIDQSVRVVVFSEPPPDLAALAAAAAGAQFVVVSSVEQTPAGNLSVIRLRPEYQAFVAGYLSALYAADYRAGALLPADGPLADGLQDAFTNGAHYYCGVCAPGWPLGVYYPQAAALPASSGGTEWQGAAAGMFDNGKVNLFYLSAEAAKPETYSYLQGLVQFDTPVLLVGEQPPPPELRDQWLATVRFDMESALHEVWPSLEGGLGGQVIEAALVIEGGPEDFEGEGRLRLVEELMAEIDAGRIYPFTVPVE